jgi:hypothetical protein
MVDAQIAAMMGVSRPDAENLMNGFVPSSVEETLGVQTIQLQSYIETGSATDALAERLGMTTAAAEELGMRLGRKGRIGLVFGMFVSR